MDTPPDKLLPLLVAAADLRAAGLSWAAVGDSVKRRAETCRQWPRRYPEEWRRLFREAEGQLITHAGAEARTMLRKLMHDKDPKVVLAATKVLLLSGEKERSLSEQRDRPDPAQVTAEELEFVRHLKAMTDAQIAALLDAHLARRSAAGDVAPAISEHKGEPQGLPQRD